MKKLILSILLTLPFINTANGESISLSYEVKPSYTIVLPTQIDISNNSVDFEISVSGDIYYDSYLQISIDDSYITSNTNSYLVHVSQDKDKFYCNELIDGVTSSINITHDCLSAGQYSGSLSIQIDLKEDE